jgi:hypothetical protein
MGGFPPGFRFDLPKDERRGADPTSMQFLFEILFPNPVIPGRRASVEPGISRFPDAQLRI